MEYNNIDTAVVIIDPQNDVLSPTGKNWDSVGASVTENNTVQHLLDILAAAKASGFGVFISPHYFYPTDSTWLFNGPLESEEFRTHTFARTGALTLEGFTGSGADWLDEFKPYVQDGQNSRCQPAQGLEPSEQRPHPATPQTRSLQGHPVRNAGEHVRGVAPTGPPRKRLRGSRGS